MRAKQTHKDFFCKGVHLQVDVSITPAEPKAPDCPASPREVEITQEILTFDDMTPLSDKLAAIQINTLPGNAIERLVEWIEPNFQEAVERQVDKDEDEAEVERQLAKEENRNRYYERNVI